MKEGVSVCITAYNVQNYIKECLDSVIRQTWFKEHNNWEIIIGVDGCQKTLDYLKKIMHNYKNLKVYMMDSNMGTYITSNTIMSMANYENVFRFDSDDIMFPNLIETVMNKKGDNVLVRYKLRDFGSTSSKNHTMTAHGTIYIKKSVFMKYGGFRPWPCAADTELHCRLRKVEKTKDIPEILMFRRIHDDSLTRNPDTGMKTARRKKYQRLINELNIQKPSDAIISCVTNTYTEVKPLVSANETDQDEYIKKLEPPEYFKLKPEPSPAPPKNNLVINKLRDDIASGRVIRIPTIGGFVWKRVK